jgi:hypothetical protein
VHKRLEGGPSQPLFGGYVFHSIQSGILATDSMLLARHFLSEQRHVLDRASAAMLDPVGRIR